MESIWHTSIRLVYNAKNDGKVMKRLRKFLGELEKEKLIRKPKQYHIRTRGFPSLRAHNMRDGQ